MALDARSRPVIGPIRIADRRVTIADDDILAREAAIVASVAADPLLQDEPDPLGHVRQVLNRVNIADAMAAAGLDRLTTTSPAADIRDALEALAAAMVSPAWQPTDVEAAWLDVDRVLAARKLKAGRLVALLRRQTTRTSKPATPDADTLTLDDDEPADEAQDGATLLNETADILRRYVVMSSADVDAAALWIGLAHAIDFLDRCPHLLFTSPTPECGKSVALTVVGALVPRPLFVANLTPATLFRSIEELHPTLLADECDGWLSDDKSELRSIFNAAHWRSGAVVPRTVGDDHRLKLFRVFGAKALGMIGLPAASLLSRCLTVKLRRRTAAEPVSRCREERIRGEHAALRRQWQRWVRDHGAAIRAADPALPDGLPPNRASDNWRVLVALADEAGGGWPERARAAALALAGTHTVEATPQTALLADVRVVFDDRDAAALSSEELITALKALPDREWQDWNHGRGLSPSQMAKRLRVFGTGPLGLRTRNTRLGSTIGKKWHREDFLDAWARFLPSEPLHPLQANDYGPQVPISEPLQVASVAGSENEVQLMITGLVAGVAGSNPENEGPQIKTPDPAPDEAPPPAAPEAPGRLWKPFRDDWGTPQPDAPEAPDDNTPDQKAGPDAVMF